MTNGVKTAIGIVSTIVGLCIILLTEMTGYIPTSSKKWIENVGEVLLIAGIWYLLIRFRRWIEHGNTLLL